MSTILRLLHITEKTPLCIAQFLADYREMDRAFEDTCVCVCTPGGVLPYKGLMGTCGQPGYVFRDFCLKQGIEFIIFCLNQGIDFSIFVLNRISFFGR